MLLTTEYGGEQTFFFFFSFMTNVIWTKTSNGRVKYTILEREPPPPPVLLF